MDDTGGVRLGGRDRVGLGYTDASMDATPSYRPRVSRETRLLLTTALVAAAALWVLARIRFPDLPASPNPVPPLLSQLTAPPTLDSLASEVFQLQGRLDSSLVVLDESRHRSPAAGVRTSGVSALRLRDDLAIALLTAGRLDTFKSSGRVVATDPASGVSVVRVPTASSMPSLTRWVPRRLERPQYLMATDASTERITLRPVFVASLEPLPNALWADPIWVIPQPHDIPVGSFVFTSAGELVGLVTEYAARRVIVPSSSVFAEAERIIREPVTPAGDLGIHVQALTTDLSSATGAEVGVVVTWVDPRGPSADALVTGDAIEASSGQPFLTPEQWRFRVARLGAGEVLTLRVRRHGKLTDVSLTAPPPAMPPERTAVLGLRMRRVSRGTELLAVEPGSAAARGGLAAGDVITLIGDLSSPTPAQVRMAFMSARERMPVLVGVTRGATHLVMTLTR